MKKHELTREQLKKIRAAWAAAWRGKPYKPPVDEWTQTLNKIWRDAWRGALSGK